MKSDEDPLGVEFLAKAFQVGLGDAGRFFDDHAALFETEKIQGLGCVPGMVRGDVGGFDPLRISIRFHDRLKVVAPMIRFSEVRMVQ
jgi:hypothetical protein